MNNNQKIIEELRSAADYLEQHDGLPELKPRWSSLPLVTIRTQTRSAEQLMEVARSLGSFKKNFTDTELELKCDLSSSVSLIHSIDREDLGCKQVVTWDCPEGLESFLRPDETSEQDRKY